MTVDIIITGVLLLIGALYFVSAIFMGEGFEAITMFFLTLCCGVVHFGLVDAQKRGNRESVTYSFPAENYKMEMVVNDKTTTVFVDGVETEATKKDTTYVITGIEPIFRQKGDKEAMHLKTVVREKL